MRTVKKSDTLVLEDIEVDTASDIRYLTAALHPQHALSRITPLTLTAGYGLVFKNQSYLPKVWRLDTRATQGIYDRFVSLCLKSAHETKRTH